MDFPTRGEVLIDGRSTSALNDAELTALRRKRIGFVFQSFQLLPTLTVLENVELPLLLAGARRNRLPRRCDRLRWVGLENKAASFPYQLSGRPDAARGHCAGLVHSPELLIADEPTGNLDNVQRRPGSGAAPAKRGAFGATVLMATHSAEAAAIADVRVRLRDGRRVDIRRQAIDRHEAAAHADSAAAGARPAAHCAHHSGGGAGRRGGGGDRPGRRCRHGFVPLVAGNPGGQDRPRNLGQRRHRRALDRTPGGASHQRAIRAGDEAQADIPGIGSVPLYGVDFLARGACAECREGGGDGDGVDGALSKPLPGGSSSSGDR